MNRSENISEIAGALAKAQGEIRAAVKDSTNPHFKSRYADLASVWEACRAPLSKHGIAVVQGPSNEDSGATSVTTLLLHSSGQWIEGKLSVAPLKNDAQGIGSVITYLRRYALAAMTGVAPDDDDGEAAVGRPPARRQDDPPQPRVEGPRVVAPIHANGQNGEGKHASWVRKAESEIDAAPTRTALEDWQKKNQATMNKLAEVDSAARDKLASRMSTKWSALPSDPLPTMAAG